jgi:clan AA aspartic protease (TIGR02281 family)
MVYLKDGRRAEGIVTMEGESAVELETFMGPVKISKEQIDRISRSSGIENEELRRQWEKIREQDRKYLEKIKAKQREIPREDYQKATGHIVVDTIINGQFRANLLLDTGASTLSLSADMARRIGIDLNKPLPIVPIQLADGRVSSAAHVVLESVQVEGMEAKNVDAVIILDEQAGMGFYDGLLGMSFLNRFNFRVDYNQNKLILERR